MDYANLGRAGVKVSRLCLGTMNFGVHTNEHDSFKIMDKALALGINFFDTANIYGDQRGEGITEGIIGRWLNQGKGRRGKIVLATKVYSRMGDGVNDRGLSAYHIKKACEDSLKRLKTDHIDLYQMHHVDREVSWDEIYQAMEQLIREGKVLYIGSSNFAGWHIAQAIEEAKRRELLGLVSEQCRYNLISREVEREVIPACRYYGMAILPWSPLGSGFLAGVLKNRGTGRKSRSSIDDWIKRSQELLKKWEGFCDELGEECSCVGLSWLNQRPGVTSIVIGPRTLEQVDSSLHALDIKLDQKSLEKLDEIFPPAGLAPEYHSW